LPSQIRGIVVFDDTRTILFTLDGSQYDVRHAERISKAEWRCLGAVKTAFGHAIICTTTEDEGLTFKAWITDASFFETVSVSDDPLTGMTEKCLICHRFGCNAHVFDRCPVTGIFVDPTNARACIKCDKVYAVCIIECPQCGAGTLHQPIVVSAGSK
jgi:hypothetical protein